MQRPGGEPPLRGRGGIGLGRGTNKRTGDERGMGRGLTPKGKEARQAEEERRKHQGSLQPDHILAGLREWHAASTNPFHGSRGRLVEMIYDLHGVGGYKFLPGRILYTDAQGELVTATTYDQISDAVVFYRFYTHDQ